MLQKSPTNSGTISLAHQGAAQWNYDRAFEAYDVYSHCLNDRGLAHPDFALTVKFSLNEYRKHMLVADKLMRLR